MAREAREVEEKEELDEGGSGGGAETMTGGAAPADRVQPDRVQKPRKWRYSHGAKNAAEKLQEQWEEPHMQGRGDVPQEVEARHEDRGQKELHPVSVLRSCRPEKLRRRSIKRNWSEGQWGRRHDETPFPTFLPILTFPPIALEPPKPPIPSKPPILKTEEGPSNPSGSGRWGGKGRGTEDALVAAANEGGTEDALVAAANEGGSCPREEPCAGAPTGG